MPIKAARHGVRNRVERFQSTLDPEVKTSSRLHHARSGAATQSNRGEPPLRWIVLATMWTRPSVGTTIVDGSIVCLENRQRIAACEQIFSNDSSARDRP